MSNKLTGIIHFEEPNKLPEIDSVQQLEDSSIGQSRCSECKYCLIIDEDGFYCISGKVQKIEQNPITGLEARIFIPDEKEFEPYIFNMQELPFPGCYEFNELGGCPMYKFGIPNKIETPEETPSSISFELGAYLYALEGQDDKY